MATFAKPIKNLVEEFVGLADTNNDGRCFHNLFAIARSDVRARVGPPHNAEPLSGTQRTRAYLVLSNLAIFIKSPVLEICHAPPS